MGRKEKTEKMVTLLGYLNFRIDNKGRTSGSRISFTNNMTGESINLHKPHPGSVMKEWMMKQVYMYLKNSKLL